PRNEGFGGGSNAGFLAARHDVVVLLNSDMRVDPGFLAPLLAGFSDELVFAVSCQIFFSDANKVREETGLTQGRWAGGRLRVRHRVDDHVSELFPCFYGGGGSCAFDRGKFLELGGFDSLFAPFYLEDTDLGFLAWKRGWKVLYQPASIVYHEHRGTIGKHYSERRIQTVLQKNFILFAWKNMHDWRRLAGHFAYTFTESLVSAFFGDSPERATFGGLWRACLRLPRALRCRARARSTAVVSDTEALRRPLGGYFRDRFAALEPEPERLGVLFVSPYPICPPVHGGGVFMFQTSTVLAGLTDLHLIVLVDFPHEIPAHDGLVRQCASAGFLVRMQGRPHALGSMTPHAVSEYGNDDLEWLIHRQTYTQKIDVVQLEYLPMAQYAGQFDRIPCILFEHDIYFQSVSRQLAHMRGIFKRLKAGFEYLRGLHYELRMLPRLDRVQVCSRENSGYVLSFLPQLEGRIDEDLRAGIDTSRYEFRPAGREPLTMLFLGSFRHLPNLEALDWFARQVLPRVRKRRPEARLIVVGSDPPPSHSFPAGAVDAIEVRGFVEDVREPLGRYGVFVCPVLSGSGMRVKLLEAFSAGIPVVSTRVGAEGLAVADGEVCALADDPAEFADRIIDLFEKPESARAMAVRARALVVSTFDMTAMTRRLEISYRAAVARKRRGSSGHFAAASRSSRLTMVSATRSNSSGEELRGRT
ncbi:MAG: glycosyltransferase, partial [Acidobacteria bacterium]|nr:glycosyltransferase [Acidobacteriota bacterium]